MACNSCSKPYTLFRKEKGCPNCGFSYCSKCLDNKIFLAKLNSEAKVCSKCKRSAGTEGRKIIEPPDAYYKFQTVGVMSNESNGNHSVSKSNDTEAEITKRLQNLKEDKNMIGKETTDKEILNRLQGIKGTQPSTSDSELQLRLANLKGQPTLGVPSKQVLCAPDSRTEQEQANDLMKQYAEQVNIDTQYRDGFTQQIDDIEARLKKLRGTPAAESKSCVPSEEIESEDEETTIKKIIEKAKAESSLPDNDNIPASTNDELPFCEICNEDARMRCLGCRYLFCKQCYMEHKDDEDGCNRYEPYKPPNSL